MYIICEDNVHVQCKDNQPDTHKQRAFSTKCNLNAEWHMVESRGLVIILQLCQQDYHQEYMELTSFYRFYPKCFLIFLAVKALNKI